MNLISYPKSYKTRNPDRGIAAPISVILDELESNPSLNYSLSKIFREERDIDKYLKDVKYCKELIETYQYPFPLSHFIVYQNDLPMIIKWKELINIRERDRWGRSILFACVENKNLDMIRILYKDEDFILETITDNDGLTPLHTACQLNWEEGIKYLESRIPTIIDKMGRLPIFYLSYHPKFIDRWLTSYSNRDFLGESALTNLVKFDQVDRLISLFYGIGFNIRLESLNLVSTALLYGAWRCLEWTVSQYTPSEEEGELALPNLFRTSYHDPLELLEILINHSYPTPCKRGWKMATNIETVVSDDDLISIIKRIERRYNTKFIVNNSSYVLNSAKNGKIKLWKYITDCLYSFDDNDDGINSLLIACLYKRIPMIEYLLSLNVYSYKKTDNEGNTILHYICSAPSPPILIDDDIIISAVRLIMTAYPELEHIRNEDGIVPFKYLSLYYPNTFRILTNSLYF